jgi:hypothetical protein
LHFVRSLFRILTCNVPGNRFGRLVLIGNFLHVDGLIARMAKSGIFTVKRYPFVDDDGEQTWPELFPTPEALEKQKTLLGEVAWQREMLLHPIADEGQDVHPEDIHYYDDPPFDDGNHLAHGVDLAISTKESADYTAIVTGEVAYANEKLEIYIQPHPVIRRMTFSDTMATLDNIRHSSAMTSEFFVEAVAYCRPLLRKWSAAHSQCKPCTPLRTDVVYPLFFDSVSN